MSTPKYDITINQNATFRLGFTITDITGSLLDISSLQFIAAIKTGFLVDDPAFLLFTSSVNIPTSTVNLSLSHLQTELLVAPRYLYDIISVNNAVSPPEVIRLIEGTAKIKYGVTDTDPTQ